MSQQTTLYQCTRCGTHKPTTHFRKVKTNASGLDSYCKTCRREYRRHHYLLSKDPNNVEALAYFEKHRREDLSLRSMKACGRCGEEKPLIEFNRMNSSADGRHGYCRQCSAIYHRAYHAANWESQNAKCRARNQLTKKARQERQRRYHKRHPSRGRATRLVNYAVKTGKLPHISTQSCVHCGQEATEYHHPDYSRPLDVVPLCRSCHKRIHVSVLQDGASIGGRRGEQTGADARRRPG